MLKVFFYTTVFPLFLISCNYFDFSKKNSSEIVNERIKEIKVNGLELYPEIYACENSTGKKCFEEQLISELKNVLLEEVLNSNLLVLKDTIWINTTVSKTGILSLKSISEGVDSNIKEAIKTTFEIISPIQPATIQGVKVNSNYKIPLILKTK